MGDGRFRKAVTTVHRNISTATATPGRMASWFRKGYPSHAPERGHSYLMALCGADYSHR